MKNELTIQEEKLNTSSWYDCVKDIIRTSCREQERTKRRALTGLEKIISNNNSSDEMKEQALKAYAEISKQPIRLISISDAFWIASTLMIVVLGAGIGQYYIHRNH